MKEVLEEVRRRLEEMGLDPALADRALNADGAVPPELLGTVAAVLDGFSSGVTKQEEKNDKK